MNKMNFDTNQWLKCEHCRQDIVPDEPKVIMGNDVGLRAFHKSCYRIVRARIELLKAEVGIE
jgi:hypothetical protein